MKTNIPFVLLFLALCLGCQNSPSEAENQSLASVSEKRENEESFKLIVWLETDEGRAQSTVTCFRKRLELEKRNRIMVNSTRYGPIGVKEVIDALRIAPDEPEKGAHGRPMMAGSLRLKANQIVQVIWRPSRNTYSVHPVNVKGVQCGMAMKSPLPKDGSGLVLTGVEGCAPISFRKAEGGGMVLEVHVAEGCAQSVDP